MLCCVVPTGQPPSRLQTSEDENIQDVMSRVQQVENERQKQNNMNDSLLNELAEKQEGKGRRAGKGVDSSDV